MSKKDYAAGSDDGYSEGYKEGLEEGHASGFLEGQQMERRKSLAEKMQDHITVSYSGGLFTAQMTRDPSTFETSLVSTLDAVGKLHERLFGLRKMRGATS